MFCSLMAVNCLDFLQFFRITDDGVVFGVDSLNKKIYHQPQVSWVSYIRFSVPLAIGQRDETI